ncbi:MAG: efflux RND transporter permease subunit [Alphaproteobacteria bacterium]|nr:efflux RND transporter permease subunit [Alphaproteobacteria bacterium]
MSSNDAGGGAGGTGTPVPRGPIAWFAANPVAAKLLMVFLIAAGAIAGSQLVVQNYQKFDLRRVSVTIPAPGSSPREVQEDIVRRVEEAIVGISGVSRVVGTAKEGIGLIDVELETFADDEAVLNDVKSAIDSIENFPPPTAEQPKVSLPRWRNDVVTIAVSSASATEAGLRLAAENLRDSLLALPNVSYVQFQGARDREIAIELSEEELRRNRLNISDIGQAIRRASLNLTFGELRTDAGGVVLQVVAKRKTSEGFKDIPLITRTDGTVVTLGDVARIRDGFVDENVLTELDGAPALFLRISATGRQSTREIRNTVLGFLESYSPPGHVSVEVWDDKAELMIERLTLILGNAVIGAVLVFICLVAVFDLRVAFWTAFGIPLAFVGSLIFFAPADLTLNIGTLFAFFLMVGIVVDDAVVVGESIATERSRGGTALGAAISGARAVAGPLVVGAATTLIALLPLLFITEGLWQVIRVIPWVALFVLAVSLVEAFFILPAHLSHDRPWSAPPLSGWQGAVRGWLDGVRDNVVAATVSWSVRHVWTALAIGILVVACAVLLLRYDAVRVLFSEQRASVSNTMQVELRLPAGSPFEATLAAAERFRDAAEGVNEDLEGASIKSVSIVVGKILSTRPGDADLRGDHLATVRAHLYRRPVRIAQPSEVERAWRVRVGDVSSLEHVEYVTSRSKVRPNLAYSIRHDDPQVLQDAARKLRSALASIHGVYGVYDNLSPGKRQLEVELTPAGKAAGLSPALLGAQLRARLHGAEAQRIQRGREEIEVVVRYPAERRRSLKELAGMRIDRPGGGEVPLSLVATLTEKQELAELTRIDGKPAVFVEAKADAAVITPIQARRLMEEGVIQELRAAHPGIAVERDGGARNERRVMETLATLVPLALIAMYAVMAAFLRSYWKPLVAAAGIPAAFAGAVLMHWILGWDFSFMSVFGIVAVSGVVVNDALVLLDRYNIIRRENDALPAIAAAAAATRHRFRAVLLTSLTTVLGLSPLLYERSDALLFLVPFVASMLGGLVLAGMFVLFLLPAMVMIADGRHE